MSEQISEQLDRILNPPQIGGLDGDSELNRISEEIRDIRFNIKASKLPENLRSFILFYILLALVSLSACMEEGAASSLNSDTSDNNETVEKVSICQDSPKYNFANNPENIEETYEHPYYVDCVYPEIRSQAPKLEDASIPLHINILYYQNVRLEDIRAGVRRDIEALNYAFEPMSLSFYISGVTEVYSEDLQEFIQNPENTSSDLRESYLPMFVENETEGKPIYYFPKVDWIDGVNFGPTVFYSTPDYQQGHIREYKDGYGFGSRILAHEIGHNLEARHPFYHDGRSDGITETIDYYKVCNIDYDKSLSFELETYVEDGICWASCPNDCSFKAEVNVMDYISCEEDVAMRFVPEQYEIMNCYVQDRYSDYSEFLNLDLPEIYF